MTEPIGLALEHLRRIQERPGRLEVGRAGIFDELRAPKSLIARSLGGQTSHEARTAAIEARLDRLEARLDLREQ